MKVNYKFYSNFIFILIYLTGSTCCFYGCYSLKEYGSFDERFIGALFKNQFGEGNKVYDYFITGNNEIINVGDKSERIVAILGYPDRDTYTIEGYRIWIYKRAGVVFYIDGETIKHIYTYENKEFGNKQTQ